MLVIAQSLPFHREPLATIVRERRAAALVRRAVAQRDAGADALDLHAGAAGAGGAAIELEWIVRTLRPALFGMPLLLDTASPATIAVALELCEREGVQRPLVANALPAGTEAGAEAGVLDPAEAALLRAVARARAGLVISPRLVDRAGAAPAAAAAIVEAAVEAAAHARAAGVSGTIYLDALVFPAASDPLRCRRALAVLRACRDVPGVERLAAVGNVSHGAPPALAAALRAVYAAAVVGAGATALILPVEERATLRAARVASGEAAPTGDGERWLVALAAAMAEDAAPPPAPAADAAYAETARLIFG